MFECHSRVLRELLVSCSLAERTGVRGGSRRTPPPPRSRQRCRRRPRSAYTALLSVSAIRVCHPGPVAFQRARVSGGSRSEMAMRAVPVLGRPCGLSILSAVALPKSFGRTACAGRARLNVSLVQAGLSWPARSGLRLRLIFLHLTSIRLPQADDMHLACPWSEHQHVQPFTDEAKGLKPELVVVLANVLNYECA